MSRRRKKKTEAEAIPPMIAHEPEPGRLRIIPLGGLGEFGKNMTVFEYEDDMVVVDCGFMLPEAGMPGVDAVIPDFSYIQERRHKLRGLLLTHGHEDHIGATTYFLRDFDIPVYGSRLTLALVREKLKEVGLINKVEMYEVHGRSIVQLGRFEVEFMNVSHSIPEAMAIALGLPIGVVIHTGDYKFDSFEGQEGSDFFTLSRYGESGVLALLSDSTNVDREGTSPAEITVLDGLRPLIAKASGTVIVSCFASSIQRVQTLLTLAEELGRVVGLGGHSLERNFSIATKLGLLHYNDDIIVPLRDMDQVEPYKRLVIVTGSQGEPLSVLSRLALGDYKPYTIRGGDTVIFSSRMIPGNEKAIYRTINHLYRKGAKVITERDAPVHASGHAYREEMRHLYRMIRPKYLMPVHGEVRNLMGSRDLAASLGMAREDIFVLENGHSLEIGRDGAIHYESDFAGQVMVDGRMIDQLEEVVLRDRIHLAEDGMVTVILVIDRKTLKIIAGPDIVTRGFVEVDTNEKLLEECKEVVARAFESCAKESKEEWDVVKTEVRKALRRFLRDRTDRYPVILPVVMEI